MSLIKLKIIKFNDSIAYEIISYDNILRSDKCQGYFNVFDDKVTQSDRDMDGCDFFINFNKETPSEFGGRGWYLHLYSKKSRFRSMGSYENTKAQYDKMIKNLNLVIEYIKIQYT